MNKRLYISPIIIVSSTGHVNIAFDEGDAIRRLEPTANTNNTSGYKRLNITHDESDVENNRDDLLLNVNNLDDSFNETTYYTDAGSELVSSVEQLFYILLEYAGIKLSVTSSIEPLFEKLGQTILASPQIKHCDDKILPNEPKINSQISTNISQSTLLNTSIELSVLSITNLNIQTVCRQSLEHS